MTMPPGLRKAMLCVHVAASVGWLGAIAAYIALNIPALTSSDEQTVRAAYLMMEPVAWYAVLPLAVASLLTGVVQALGTPWGLFRHYWVLISLALTLFATVILVLHLPAIGDLADRYGAPGSDLSDRDGDLFHSVGGLVVLLVPMVLNIFKPRGLTRYGAQAAGGSADAVISSADFWRDVENPRAAPSQERTRPQWAVPHRGEHHDEVPASQALPRRAGGGQRRADGPVDPGGDLRPLSVHE